MAVTRETLRLLDGMRVAMLAPVDATAQALIHSWGVAWNELSTEWASALEELAAASTDGAWPTRTQIARATRARKALAITREALDALTADLPVQIIQALPDVVDAGADWSRRLTASQYPPEAGTAAQVMGTFDRVDPAALKAIVERTAGQVTALSYPISAQAEQAMKAVLVRGVAVGDNPRSAAAQMLDRVNGAFDGGRNRALVIARTEMLDAHRAGGMAQEAASKDVLAAWQWVAQLDARTCPSCWAQHGSRHDITEAGPLDHQQGRCARVPVTKTWRELGFNIDEPPSLLPDARAVFDGLPQETRAAIMGAKRLELLDAGDVSWSDLSRRRVTDGWRDSFAPTPLRDLI